MPPRDAVLRLPVGPGPAPGPRPPRDSMLSERFYCMACAARQAQHHDARSGAGQGPPPGTHLFASAIAARSHINRSQPCRGGTYGIVRRHVTAGDSSAGGMAMAPRVTRRGDSDSPADDSDRDSESAGDDSDASSSQVASHGHWHGDGDSSDSTVATPAESDSDSEANSDLAGEPPNRRHIAAIFGKNRIAGRKQSRFRL